MYPSPFSSPTWSAHQVLTPGNDFPSMLYALFNLLLAEETIFVGVKTPEDFNQLVFTKLMRCRNSSLAIYANIFGLNRPGKHD
ncbi:hypothetical protein OIU77_009914 [Salix suchowensis]|uniref:Uncharacterized protein n=1 Tax=Salix suchowensis TaxID=1278906 RepID=A0ABQ9A6J6_9ROSI|nr:hypothetical protein OIU77_009914 [Salix suchowensis]